MKKIAILAALCGLTLSPVCSIAQEEPQAPTVLSLDQAIRIALSENIAVRVADKDIERAEYARKGSYAALFPQVDGSASYSRTIKKQVMYMDFDMGSFGGFGGGGETGDETGGEAGGAETKAGGGGTRRGGGMEEGRAAALETATAETAAGTAVEATASTTAETTTTAVESTAAAVMTA